MAETGTKRGEANGLADAAASGPTGIRPAMARRRPPGLAYRLRQPGCSRPTPGHLTAGGENPTGSPVRKIWGTSGFAFSLSMVLLGLFHNWFAIPAADAAHVQALFAITWGIVCVFLAWIMFKLPALYGAIMIFVVATLGLLAAGFWSGNTDAVTGGGAAILAFSLLGFWAWLNVASEAGGGPAWPPLGPPLRP